jgi:hypothetical protein
LRITKNRIEELVKNQQHYKTYKDKMPRFENMYCEIAGWCGIKELEKVTKIPGLEFNGERYVKQSGKLNRSRKSWKKLLRQI